MLDNRGAGVAVDPQLAEVLAYEQPGQGLADCGISLIYLLAAFFYRMEYSSHQATIGFVDRKLHNHAPLDLAQPPGLLARDPDAPRGDQLGQFARQHLTREQ